MLYIGSKERKTGPFFYNRVKEIRSLTNTEDWYHVPGPLNATDLPSRGCNVETLRCQDGGEELATSLSTENFLRLRRFIAQRGRPSIITDNGLGFTGAENLLKKIDWNVISQYSGSQKIIWKFIPPSAPWWGGWWNVDRNYKRNFTKILGKSSLNLKRDEHHYL
ncbi:DUF5641 domain-containing protein [Trichonephila inaurata madagascariensis]|uniref:DUF5641 domain-containing protein n=1 Tax=Trichonephila inaurata madagascariensis TaxID=2747483 RepID=A0A8X6IS42_9ARAC|nr:DUF5641 domain-containing protein [Trichonephila inaurata madagascariensis]